MSGPLTKEYIFACRLKNVPIALHAHHRRGSLKKLLEYKVLEEGKWRMMGAQLGYNVLYPIETEPGKVLGKGSWVSGDKAW